MSLQPIAYEHDGTRLTGYLADGSGGRPSSGILVAHEGGGLSRHTRDKALRLAALGYVGFAVDYYGEEDPGLERAKELGLALRKEPARLRGRVAAGFDILVSQPNVDRSRLAAIGYCMGGAAIIDLARTGAPLACLVGFHAGFLPGTAEENRAIAGRLLLCHGEADPAVTAAQRDTFLTEMKEAGVDWQLHLYGGVGHSFTNPDIDRWNLPGFAYDERADARSWMAMLDLFDETFGPS